MGLFKFNDFTPVFKPFRVADDSLAEARSHIQEVNNPAVT